MKGLIVLVAFAAIGIVFATPLMKALPVCPPYDPEGEAVTLPNVDDCSSFYICDGDDNPILDHCDLNLWFNPTAGVCDYPENIAEGICKPPGNFTM